MKKVELLPAYNDLCYKLFVDGVTDDIIYNYDEKSKTFKNERLHAFIVDALYCKNEDT